MASQWVLGISLVCLFMYYAQTNQSFIECIGSLKYRNAVDIVLAYKCPTKSQLFLPSKMQQDGLAVIDKS